MEKTEKMRCALTLFYLCNYLRFSLFFFSPPVKCLIKKSKTPRVHTSDLLSPFAVLESRWDESLKDEYSRDGRVK